MPEPALLISLVALVVSAINFFFSAAAFRRTHYGLLTIETNHSASADQVTVTITNTGSRPLSISELVLGYGTAPMFLAPVLDLLGRIDKRLLAIGESCPIKVPSKDIRSAVVAGGLKQGRYRRAWIRAKVAGGPYVDDLVMADESILPPKTLKSAAMYIATDLMFGFEPMEPEVNPPGRLK